ncbi:multidrug efflux SMR transporter [Microcoleus sp. AT9_B5]
MSSWIYILLAIVLEVVATSCMKLSEGFSKVVPSVLMFVCYGLCFSLLALALKKLELGVVYAVWSGLGTILIAAIGIIWFHESASLVKIGAILLIIIGVVILKVNHEPVTIQGREMLLEESALNVYFETTEPVKTQDMLPTVEDAALLMSQMPIKSPELENL